MRFKLGKHTVAFDPVIIAESDNIDELDFSDLHNCNEWSIWVVCDGKDLLAAVVNWASSSRYVMYNEASGDRFYIASHSMIIPTVKFAVAYNHLFHNFTTPCRVFPGLD